MAPVDWREFNLAAWRRMDPVFRARAVTVAREKIAAEDVERIRGLADADPAWLAGYHFVWGMWMRNALRHAGLRDDALPPSPSEQNRGDCNWDDYYGAVVEVAVKGGIYTMLAEAERL